MQQINISKVSVHSKRYNPDQPRVPAGQTGGGQWTSSGRAGGGSAPATPERAPWSLTSEEWAAHVKSRAGYPGLPPHTPDWREREGLLPGRLDIQAVKIEEDSWYGDKYRFTVGSPHTPDTEDVQVDLTSEEWSREGVRNLREFRVDKSVGEMVAFDDDGWKVARLKVTDSRYTEDEPSVFNYKAETDKNGVWRGMSGEEMESAMQQGHFQSAGSHNLAGQEGLTFFSDRPSQALSYASGFAPWTHKPTFETPSYVVRVRRPEESRTRINPKIENEVGVTGRVPVEDMTEVWEVRLAAEKRGTGDVRIDRTGSVDDKGFSSQNQYYVYRQVPPQEWAKIKPYHQRMQERKR